MTNRLWGLLLLLACFWGGSFVAYEIGLQSLPVSSLVMYRIGGAALFLWILALAFGWKIPRGKVWGEFLMLGLLNNAIPFFLIAWGQQFIESGLSSILNGATALFGAILAPFFFADERLTVNKLVGVILGFLGVSIAIGIETLHNLDPRNLGQLAVIAASLSYAFGGIWAKKRVKTEPKITALGMLTMGTVLMVVMHFTTDPTGALIPSLHSGLAAAYLAIVGTAFAYLLFYKVLGEAGVSYVTLITLLIPVIAITLGAIILSERLHNSAFLGFGIVAIGLMITDGRLVRKAIGFYKGNGKR